MSTGRRSRFQAAGPNSPRKVGDRGPDVCWSSACSGTCLMAIEQYRWCGRRSSAPPTVVDMLPPPPPPSPPPPPPQEKPPEPMDKPQDQPDPAPQPDKPCPGTNRRSMDRHKRAAPLMACRRAPAAAWAHLPLWELRRPELRRGQAQFGGSTGSGAATSPTSLRTTSRASGR